VSEMLERRKKSDSVLERTKRGIIVCVQLFEEYMNLLLSGLSLTSLSTYNDLFVFV